MHKVVILGTGPAGLTGVICTVLFLCFFGKPSNPFFDLVPNPAEHRHHFLFSSFRFGRIIEPPMLSPNLGRSHGTLVVGIATEGDHVIGLVQDLGINDIRGLFGDVDPFSFITFTALGLRPWASMPALYTLKRSPRIFLAKPSAI